jgi:hypothetical protein
MAAAHILVERGIHAGIRDCNGMTSGSHVGYDKKRNIDLAEFLEMDANHKPT